jgi:antitoxin (DNA-binding transcriptional repressor) of toxin-antitoxin stability system
MNMAKPRKQVTASDFKARCGQLIEEVSKGKGPVVITRRGKPVAKLEAFEAPARQSLFGFAKGSITIHGDILSPIDVEWEAAK